MNNYEFCAPWIRDQEHGNAFRVLDYGCGSEQIVEQLKKRSVEASGRDVFYQGGFTLSLGVPAHGERHPPGG